jgi:hypothetical protein
MIFKVGDRVRQVAEWDELEVPEDSTQGIGTVCKVLPGFYRDEAETGYTVTGYTVTFDNPRDMWDYAAEYGVELSRQSILLL